MLATSGYFHDLCIGPSQYVSDETLLEVVLVLSHIFGRFPVGHISEEWKKVIHRSPSVVLLPPLPDAALRIIREHNANTLAIFKDYASTFVDQHLADKPDRYLPFTGSAVGKSDHEYCEEDLLHQKLGSLGPTKLRSPFSALSGFSDDSFQSIHELCSSARDGLFLEESAIPFVPIYPDDTNGPWNAYLYDFFKHGDIKALVQGNHAKRGDIWFQLKNFSLILATIVTSLRNFMSPETSDDDLTMITDNVQNAKNAIWEQEDEDSCANNGGPEKSTVHATNRPKVNKAVIVAAWEDDSDDNEDVIVAQENDESRSDASGSQGAPAWDGNGEHKLPKILAMFVRIQQEFDTKFKAMWA